MGRSTICLQKSSVRPAGLAPRCCAHEWRAQAACSERPFPVEPLSSLHSIVRDKVMRPSKQSCQGMLALNCIGSGVVCEGINEPAPWSVGSS